MLTRLQKARGLQVVRPVPHLYRKKKAQQPDAEYSCAQEPSEQRDDGLITRTIVLPGVPVLKFKRWQGTHLEEHLA